MSNVELAIGRFARMVWGDMRRIRRAGVAHMGVSAFVTRFGALAQRILLARILGPENIGHIAVVTSATNIIRLPAGVGTFTVVNKLVAENQGDEIAQKQIVGTSLIINLVTSLVVGASAWLMLSHTAMINDPVANRLLRVLVLFLPLMISVEVLRNCLMGQRRMRTAATLDVVLAIVTILVVVPMAYFWSLNGWFLNKILSIILGLVLLVWCCRSVMSLNWNRDVAKSVASIGSFAFLHQLTGSLLLQFDTLSVSGILHDPAATGIYNNAALMAQQLQFIPVSVLTVAFPYIAQDRGNWPRLRARYRELSRKIGILALVLCAASWVVAPWFFPVFGREFTGSVGPFRILVLGFVARSLYVLNNTYLDALGRTDVTFATGLLAAALTITLNLIFIPIWGLMGAAWATTLSMFASLILRQASVQYFIFRKHATR